MGIADLPDIDEDDWYAYSADTFSRATRPLSDSASFLAQTSTASQPIYEMQARTPPPVDTRPVTIAPPPPTPGPFGGGPFGNSSFGSDGLSGGQQQPQQQPYFTNPDTPVTDLFDELTSFDGDGEAPNYKVTTAPLGAPAGTPGTPEPNIFGAAAEGLNTWAQQQRESGFSQTPIIGPMVTGGAQALSGTLESLSGSREAIRQGLQGDIGQLGMGIAGTANAALNALGDLPRGMATEAQWPEQIIPGIDPNTPVIGGLNNPRELVGLGTDLLIPETAVERAAGHLVGQAARPVARAIAENPVAQAVGQAGMRLLTEEEGSLRLPGGRRSPRQGIPDFGETQPPIAPEQWEVMTPRQRRNARDAAEAGRPYQPLAPEQVAARREMREAQRIQEEVNTEVPDLAPVIDPTPPAEPAGDVLQRVLGEMSPAGRQEVEAQARLFGRRAPWMRDVVGASEQVLPEGQGRYSQILELASGEREAGDDLAKQMTLAETDEDAYVPPTAPPRLNARGRERLGGLRALADLPEEQQQLAEAVRNQTARDLMEAHGFRSEQDSREAAERIMPYILQFARGAKPNEPVNEALLRAGREAWAQSVMPMSFADIDYWKTLNDPDALPEMKQASKEARDYWNAVNRVLGRYGGETAPSEVARGFRSLQDRPQGLGDIVAGGAPEATEAVPQGPPTNRRRVTPREKAYEDMLSKMRQARRGEEAARPADERTLRRAQKRVAGKRPGSDLDALGIEWSDVLRRDDNDDWNRVKILAGLQDIGGYRMRRDWLERAMKLDLGDTDAVKNFWTEARASRGLDESGLPLVKFNPMITGQSYLGVADTITKEQALRLVSKELIKDMDAATAAVRRARAEGALPAEIADLTEQARGAYGRAGLNIDEWPEDSFPLVSRAMDSVRARIEKEWPADRPRGGGNRLEDVGKKRQLLGIFDQEVRKEQKLAGVPVNGIQDLLSFGTSNVLMTPRFVQASLLESAMSAINEPLQSLLKGQYAVAGQQLRGLGRAFGLLPDSDDLAALGEGIRAPALVNGLRGLQDIGPMQAAGEMRQVAQRGANLIRSDSANRLAKLFSPMHRVSRGISEAFQTANYFGEVNRLAHMASETGKLPGGGKIAQVIDNETGNLRFPTPRELFGNLPQEIVDEALKTSKLISEGGEVGVIEKKLGELKGLLNKPNASGAERAQGIFANLMFPFVFGLRPMIRSGMGVLTSPVKHPYEIGRALLRGDTEGAKYTAKKFALANAFNGYIAYNVMAGNITGHGPSDTAVRQALMEGTDENGDPIWRPDSIRLPAPDGGHFWLKYNSLPGPVSIVATVMGNMYDAYAYDGKDLETAPETAARMAQQVAPAVLDNTYFRDFINLSEAMNANGGVNAMLRVAGQMGGRFIPGAGALRLVATASDPYQRLTTNPAEDIASGIPGLRQLLPAQVSAYTGEAVEQGINPATLAGGLSGNIYSAPSQPNPAAAEVAELNRRPLAAPWDWERTRAPGASGPRSFTRGEQARGAEFAGQRQTGEAIRGAQEEFGQSANQRMMALINSPQYQALPPEQKAAQLERVVTQSREAGEYAAEGRVALDPQRQLQRRMQETPRYYGVTGTPQEIAAQNQRIASARDALAQLSQRYGRDMAMALLAQQSPQAFQLAMSYPPVNRDQLWVVEQQAQQELGYTPEATDTLIPDYGSGATAITAPGGAINARTLPPSLRRILS